MSSHNYGRRQVVCEVCGRHCRTEQKNRDICRACYCKETSVRCMRCGLLKHQVATDSGLCPRCKRILDRLVEVCDRCGRVRTIHSQEDRLCRACAKRQRRVSRQEGSAQKTQCTVCGQMRVSVFLSKAICRSCLREAKNGRAPCSKCRNVKIIHDRANGLCLRCYQDRLAPNTLHRFVENFTTPYPYNKRLFDLLASTIEWESVTYPVNQRFHSFGHLLQTYRFSEPLTWEAIEGTLPSLEPMKNTTREHLRTCLLALGHLLSARGKLESREAFLMRRRALAPIGRVPKAFQPVFISYAAWLWERKATPSDVQHQLIAVTAFWSWCEGHGIRTLAEVQAALVNDYLLTLYWQWRCSVCQDTVTFDPWEHAAPRTCPHCNAIGSLGKEKKLTQNTVRGYRGYLRVFFSWASSNRLVLANPVQRQTKAPRPTIRHYPPEVIKELCTYIPAPKADPTEAMVLYLIVFHALSVWELQHAQMPNFHPLRGGIVLPTLAEAFHIRIPRAEPSLGDSTPGRPYTQVNFPLEAASWLKPLLERYEGHRRKVVKSDSNRYLLCSQVSAHHNIPVGKTYVEQIVRQAALQALGKACSPNTLRKTVGVMFADRAGAGILRFLGWDSQQAFAYTWAERLAVHPQQIDPSYVTGKPVDATPENLSGNGRSPVCSDSSHRDVDSKIPPQNPDTT